MTQTQVRTSDSAALRQVHLLYQLVDAGDAAGIAQLLAPDAVYHRPGYEPMVGRERVFQFYHRERIIAEGRHLLETMIADEFQVAVNGQFLGTLRNGNPVELRFADFFEMDEHALIVSRRTFYFTHTV
jgi:ketosteroid isomerase-like protein